jgi:SAM-dependent methyltransferase
MSVLGSFLRLNRRMSHALRMPHAEDLHAEYVDVVRDAIRAARPRLVVDVGGGKRCPFADARAPGTRIVAVDVSAEELQHNTDVDEIRVSDATRALPFEDGSVDLLTSRSALEHFPDLDPFFAETARVLSPGGETIHVFPCRWAPFALVNQALPRPVSRWALHSFLEGSRGIHGFPAHYDRCWPSAIERLARDHGLVIRELRLSWYQSEYFAFLTPAYVASCAYELLVRRLGARNLCAYMLLRAVRPG